MENAISPVLKFAMSETGAPTKRVFRQFVAEPASLRVGSPIAPISVHVQGPGGIWFGSPTPTAPELAPLPVRALGSPIAKAPIRIRMLGSPIDVSSPDTFTETVACTIS